MADAGGGSARRPPIDRAHGQSQTPHLNGGGPLPTTLLPPPLDEPTSPFSRVLDDESLVGALVEHIAALSDRLRLRRVCKFFRRTLDESPHLWRALLVLGADDDSSKRSTKNVANDTNQNVANDTNQNVANDTNKNAANDTNKNVANDTTVCTPRGHAFHPRAPYPRTHLTSVSVRDSATLRTGDVSVAWPRLIELSLAGVRGEVDEFLLRQCFGHCGATLRRLDLSRVRLQPHRPGVDLFERLAVLEVLVARDVEGADGRPVHPNRIPCSWILPAAMRAPCAASHLTALTLGWSSEFKPPAAAQRHVAPFLETDFSDPLLVLPLMGGLAERCPKLTTLSLSGYALLYDEFLEGSLPPRLATFDACGGQLASDAGLAAALSVCAATLSSLNVRGTKFGDEAALALAARHCNLERLNASCTKLTPRGLLALSQASDRLRVLDLCYAQAACEPEGVLAVARRHGERLEMLGIGGCGGLTNEALEGLLGACCGGGGWCASGPPGSGSGSGSGGAVGGAPSRPRLCHVGIGGCEDLDGRSALAAVADSCHASLTALSAHKLRNDVGLGGGPAAAVPQPHVA